MTFIVTLIALLIERFFDWSHLRQWRWYMAYQRMIARRLAGKSSYLILAATIIPLLIIIGLIGWAIRGSLYGFITLLFELFILIYCLGPRNLWADTFACINALTNGDAHFAADKLKASFNITEINDGPALHRSFLNTIFIEANRRIFAVIFWYLILGPIGAILYRCVALAANEADSAEMPTDLTQSARRCEAILDWLPVRVLTFIFALGGHFVRVLSCWRKKVLQGLSSNDRLLTECGIEALGNQDEQGAIREDGSAEKNAISLLDRVFVIVLVIIAVIVLLG